MAGRIPQQFIDDLISRVDIVDVIETHLPLRKSGRDYSACCPFHDEKTPSFTVSQEKQFYHCFGCGAHGTVIGFLMEYDHLDFIEAVQELASRAGLEIPIDDQGAGHHPVQKSLYELLMGVSVYYRKQLKNHEQGKTIAINYLKDRGLSGEIAAEYGIGFAPPGWDNLQQEFGPDKTIQDQLLTTGMLIKKEKGGAYDRFRNRIIFPILDARGRVIGFGGRALGDDTPKYLNSPETPVFHKGRELYGLFEARKSVRHLDRLLVVEGYMDVIMLAQYGIRYAVATMGTATTREHLERMFRVVPEIVFCFDGDRAGREAAERALENILPVMKEGRQARFMFLPDGEDPDSLVRKEKTTAFEQRIVNAIPLSSYFFENLEKRVDMSSIDGQSRLVELARPQLSKFPEGVFKHMMINRLAEITRMETGALTRLLLAEKIPGQKKQINPAKGFENVPKSPVRTGIMLLLQNPALAQKAEDIQMLKAMNIRGMGLFVELLELLHSNPHLTTGALLEHWRDREEGPHLAKLAQQESLIATDELEQEFYGTLKLLHQQHQEQRMKYFSGKTPSKMSKDEKDEYYQLTSYRSTP